MADPSGPVLEMQRICSLATELDSPAYALRFLTDFLDMLPGRLTRILRVLRDRDAKESLDSLLSLKITSSMAGALDTEEQCETIEALVRGGSLEAAADAGTQLAETVNALLSARTDVLAEAVLAVSAYNLEPALIYSRSGSCAMC